MTLLIRLSANLPLWFLHLLGAALGWLVYLGSPIYRRRFGENLALAGVPVAEGRRAIAEAGKLVTELPWIWLRPREQKLPKITWDSVDLVESAMTSGKGLIIVTPHVGCFEAVGQIQAAQFGPRFGDFTVLFRPSKTAWFDALMQEVRAIPGMACVPTNTGGVRQIVKALRQGKAVGMLPDQVPPEGMGVWAPFFGKPAYTMTLALRLARQTGATLLFALGDRLPWGRGYVVRVEALDLPLDQSDEVAAAAMNAAMERIILKRPHMYLWSYARYKLPRKDASAGAH